MPRATCLVFPSRHHEASLHLKRPVASLQICRPIVFYDERLAFDPLIAGERLIPPHCRCGPSEANVELLLIQNFANGFGQFCPAKGFAQEADWVLQASFPHQWVFTIP